MEPNRDDGKSERAKGHDRADGQRKRQSGTAAPREAIHLETMGEPHEATCYVNVMSVMLWRLGIPGVCSYERGWHSSAMYFVDSGRSKE